VSLSSASSAGRGAAAHLGELELARGALHNHVLHGVAAQQAHDRHGLCLADPVHARGRLQIRLRA